MRPLNPSDIVSQAWRLTWQQRQRWYDMAIIPLIWSLLIGVILAPNQARYVTFNPQDPVLRGEAFEFLGLALLVLLLSLLAWATFAVAWMRYCLGSPPDSRGPVGLSLTALELRLAGGAIRLSLIYFVAFCLIMLTLGSSALTSGIAPANITFLGFAAILAASPILARLSLILPAASIGAPSRLADSWRLTTGVGMRLTGLLLGVTVAAFLLRYVGGVVAAAIIVKLFTLPLSLGPRTVLVLLLNLMTFASSAFVLAVLAVCYRRLGGGGGLQVVRSEIDQASSD